MQDQPSKSFVARFEALAGTSTKRRVDLELRILDVVFALAFGLLVLPLALLIAAVVAATSGLPVLYRGERVGRGGRFFTILKFRTLKGDAETRLGPYLGEELVRRTHLEYTRVGRAVKATQLDELPQFWNVLRGDMSFVGPRPIRPRFFEQLASELPAYWQRLVVRPGGAPVPADALRDRVACRRPNAPRAVNGSAKGRLRRAAHDRFRRRYPRPPGNRERRRREPRARAKRSKGQVRRLSASPRDRDRAAGGA